MCIGQNMKGGRPTIRRSKKKRERGSEENERASPSRKQAVTKRRGEVSNAGGTGTRGGKETITERAERKVRTILKRSNWGPSTKRLLPRGAGSRNILPSKRGGTGKI